MSVTLKCEIDANPWSQPNWIKDITGQSSISIADMDPPPLRTDEEGSFTIISAKVSDSGWYRCVADQPGLGHFTSFSYYLNVRCESNQLSILISMTDKDTCDSPSHEHETVCLDYLLEQNIHICYSAFLILFFGVVLFILCLHLFARMTNFQQKGKDNRSSNSFPFVRKTLIWLYSLNDHERERGRWWWFLCLCRSFHSRVGSWTFQQILRVLYILFSHWVIVLSILSFHLTLLREKNKRTIQQPLVSSLESAVQKYSTKNVLIESPVVSAVLSPLLSLVEDWM